ncbi:MAG TPA: DUF4097 family beta strand repeat-containing protein [Terriglobales bacterium]|nr:DUF4097 family beta strand repeat-containing protein [Terriglobales bacterium]
MKHAIKLAGVAVSMVALASLALCQEAKVYREGGNWVQEMTGDLGAAKNLRVKLAAGSVRVQGGAQAGITYVIHRRAYTSSEQQARREFESYRISTSLKGDTAWIVAESSRRDAKCADDFVISVPRGLESAKIETGGGSVNATGVAGRVDLSSGGGNIHLDDIGGEVTAETGGGSIEVGSAAGNVSLQTGGGNIKVASAKGEIKAASGGGSVVVLSGLQGAVLETGGGSIRVDKCSGRVKATTGGGSIDLGDIGGPAEIETGAGSIRLASAKGRVQAQTGGGSIQLDGATSVQAETSAGGIIVKLVSATGGASRNDSTLETSAGDITVYLANDLAVSVRAEIESANGHTIRSDFSDIHVSSEGGPWEKTVTAEGQLNGGGPVLKVRTNSGNVSFRRINR